MQLADYAPFARMYAVAFDFIKLYRQNRTTEEQATRYTDMAVLLLYERLLTEMLQNIEVVSEKPKPVIATTNKVWLALRGRPIGES